MNEKLSMHERALRRAIENGVTPRRGRIDLVLADAGFPPKRWKWIVARTEQLLTTEKIVPKGWKITDQPPTLVTGERA